MGDTVKEQRKQTNELEEDKQKINDNAYLPEEISKNCKYELANC